MPARSGISLVVNCHDPESKDILPQFPKAQIIIKEDGAIVTYGDQSIAIDAIALLLRSLPSSA